MIQINLLDPAQVKGGRKSIAAIPSGASGAGSFIVAAAVVLALGLNLALGWSAWQRVAVSQAACARVKSDYKSVQAEIDAKTKDADQVRKFREVVANQMDVLRSLDPPDRILWSQKINMLASLVPAAVFVDEVRVNEDVQMVETDASKTAIENWKKNTKNNKGPQPKQVFRPVIRYHMVLVGLAMGKDNIEQFNNVMAFHRALTGHRTVDAAGHAQRFMDGFESDVKFDVIKGEVYEEVPVNKFVFKLTTLPLGDEPRQKPAEARVASAR